jgi:uncharacterized membrane-anchored protein
MALRFSIGDQVYNAAPKSESTRRWHDNVAGEGGYAVVTLDERNIGAFKKLYHEQTPTLGNNEILMRYRVRNREVKFATNAFFFQEGHGKYYQPARYGQFRVDDKGELLLVAMHDKSLVELGPP